MLFNAVRKQIMTYQAMRFHGSELSANEIRESLSVEVNYDEIDKCAWLNPGGYVGLGDFFEDSGVQYCRVKPRGRAAAAGRR